MRRAALVVTILALAIGYAIGIWLFFRFGIRELGEAIG